MHKEEKKGVASMKKHNSKPKNNSYGEINKPKMVLRKKKKVKSEGGSGNY
tara:strand:+ start:825 stop:974 length:150 start_codon:yes stop_codon:yes gene_type:complete